MFQMDLSLREPASTLTHAAWGLFAIPLLWRLIKATGEPAKRMTISVYGLSLLACASASTVFHAVKGDIDAIEWYNRLDHIGIGLLIAGTYTPIAFHLLEAKVGGRILAMIWLAAGGVGLLRLTVHPIPKGVAIFLYLMMGWGALPGYAMLWRRLDWARVRLIAEGGLFYTVGAIIHWQDAPNLVPGVFGAHDAFHILVMLGSFRHYQFMERVVLPTFDAESLGVRGYWAVTASLLEDRGSGRMVIPRPYFWRRDSMIGREERQKLR